MTTFWADDTAEFTPFFVNIVSDGTEFAFTAVLVNIVSDGTEFALTCEAGFVRIAFYECVDKVL